MQAAKGLRPSRGQGVSPSFALRSAAGCRTALRAALRVGDPPPLALATPGPRRTGRDAGSPASLLPSSSRNHARSSSEAQGKNTGERLAPLCELLAGSWMPSRGRRRRREGDHVDADVLTWFKEHGATRRRSTGCCGATWSRRKGTAAPLTPPADPRRARRGRGRGYGR